MKYHNESNLTLGELDLRAEEERKKQQQADKKRKEEELNNKLPSYDPKNATKTTIYFGE